MRIPLPTTILKFVLAAVVGMTFTLGVAAVTQSGPQSTATTGPSTLYQAPAGDVPVAFTTTSSGGTLVPLEAPPANQGIQLTTYTANPSPPPTSDSRPAWVNPTGYPRVPAISQFDGGPWQAYDCTMASGAMLARLGYGIVTTGSQLRSMQPNQGPTGTNLNDVNAAVGNGWGVHFAEGALTPLQFRALIYAGAGAILQGVYGQLPASERIQKSFVAAHAIYIDGFQPPQGGQPARYYVIDPIGQPWTGYKGAWLPATDIEAFATAFGSGRMVTAWAFPGGLTPPANYKTLPPDAYPTNTPGPSPSAPVLPSASASALPSGSPSASAVPSPVALPSASAAPPDSSGTSPPVVPTDVSILTKLAATAGGWAVQPSLGVCITSPIPIACPSGLIGTYPSGSSPGPLATPPSLVDLLFASVPQPGEVQIIFTGPGSASSLDFWRTDGSGPVQPAAVQPATLGGKSVWVATFPVQTGSYGFSAGTLGSGMAGMSQLGNVTIGQ
jgi:hypothetical protein